MLNWIPYEYVPVPDNGKDRSGTGSLYGNELSGTCN